ncbi:MAG: MFS transporter [Anaerolineales bacterium]|nr:MFS transporter [Anaerolineales bacterium]
MNASDWRRPFFVLWSGQAVSLFGSSLVQFALIWWLTQTTGSATVLATASLVGLLPQVLLGPVAGVVVDRASRRVVMIVADSLVAAFTLGLALLFWAGLAQLWHVYVILLARAVAGAFHFPAMQASTGLMVPEAQLARVAGFNQTLQAGMGIVAPPVGALLLSLLPMQGVLAVDVVTAVAGVAPLFFLRIPRPPARPAGAAQPSFTADLAAGLRYVAGWPGLLIILGMAAVINLLLVPAGSLIPILVTRHFGGAAAQLATMESAFSLGMVAGGLVLGVWGGFKRRIVTSLLGLAGLGLGTLVVGLAPADGFWLAVAGSFAMMAMSALTNGPLFAVLQAAVAPEMHGRVFTLIGSLSALMAPLGLLAAGPVADALGVQVWYQLGGLACLVMAGLGLALPVVRDLEARRPAAPAPTPIAAD